MPKKQKPHFTSKPSTAYVHPSLSSTPRPSQAAQDASSVNARLDLLRRIQSPRVRPKPLEQEGITASRHAPSSASRRRAPGPPPPRSWLVGQEDEHAAAHVGEHTERLRPPTLDALPGRSMPEAGTLLDISLRNIARDLDWHVEYDRHYLSVLPLEIRSWLLSYVAYDGPNSGISLAGLRCLFADAGIDTAGPEELRRLDLAGSIGRALPLKELERAWTKKGKTNAKSRAASDALLDSWDQDPELDLARLSLSPPLWFPSLTHLSLAYPPAGVSWTDLLSFSRHLGSLTHLSLAAWPRPTLPRSATTSPAKQHSTTDEDDIDHDDARGILSLLSRNTPSLTSLSLARCHAWFDDLAPRPTAFTSAPPTPAARARRAVPLRSGPAAAVSFADDGDTDDASPVLAEGAEWAGAWRRIARVDVSQESIPADLQSHDLRAVLSARAVNAQPGSWDFADAQMRASGLRVVAPSAAVEESMRAAGRRRAWLGNEQRAGALAGMVRALRGARGAGRCEFTYGWDRSTLLAAGYAEHILFEAGM